MLSIYLSIYLSTYLSIYLRSIEDEKRMAKLEEELKDARNQAEDADKKYDEVQFQLFHSFLVTTLIF